MAAYRNIDDFCPRNTYSLVRNIPSTPNNITITDAWWIVKADSELPDSTAMFELHITPAASASGQVFNYIDLTAQLLFTAQPEDSSAMFGMSPYFYDIQIQLADNTRYTIETGKLFTLRAVKQS